MLPWKYGGMNMPETLYQMMVEIISRAEAGLMTIFGLQEIASSINEFGGEEMKARVLPRFSRGEVAGAMVLTEPDAGSDLGSVQTPAPPSTRQPANGISTASSASLPMAVPTSNWYWRAVNPVRVTHAVCRYF